MAVNIGPKIGIEGEKEYRKSVNDLITQQKTFSAQMKELESSFDDETSAMEKNRKKSELLEKQISNQEKQVEELEKGLKASAEKYGENAAETQRWKQAVSNGKTELNKLKKELDKIPKPLQQVGKNMQDAGKKISSFGESFTKKISAPIAALGGLSIAAFNEVDEGLDIVTVKTGATGEALASLQGSVKTLATQIPTDFATAGEAIGEVNTRFGLTGTELETLSGKFVKFAQLNNTDVSSSVDSVQKLMSAFGVETKDAGKVLDALNKTGQNTGISMDKLESSMIKNASALQNMGMDAYQAATFIGQVETSGANTETVMTGMSKALTNAAKDGKTLPQALGEFQAVMESSATKQEKLNAAMKLFGNKAGPAIYEACEKGSLSFKGLSDDATEYLGSVETTFENTLDAPDKMQIALNNLKVVGSELGGTLLDIATPAIEAVGEAAQTAGELFNGLTEEQQEMVRYVTAALAVGGPAVMAVGNLTEAAGKVIEKFGEIPGVVGKISGSIGSLLSPAGLTLGAIAGLTAAMIYARDHGIKSNEALQTMLSDTSEATTALNEATGALRKVISDTDEDIENINAKASVAGDLVDELYDLAEQSNKTAAEEGRMYMIVDQLNEMYPNLALQIDKTTGTLNKGKAEVKKYVDEAKKLALIEAYGKASQEILEKMATASINLKKAQWAQKEGQEYLTQAQEDYNKAIANAPTAMAGQNAMLDEASGRWIMVTGDVINAANAVKLAEGNMVELNTAVSEGEQAVADADAEYQLYTEAADELSATITETTAATEGHTEALNSETEGLEENTSALAENAAELGKDVKAAVSNIQDNIKAWDDLYQATRDSIDGQLKLFDEWDTENKASAGDMLKNLQSQTKGMQSWEANMKRLSSEAVKSSDPNFKALVQSINEMGVDGAAYAQALVDAMDNDKETFNAILNEFGANSTAKDNLAQVETYISNDFKTKTGTAIESIATAIKGLGESQGWKNFVQAAKTSNASVKKETDSYVASTAKAGTSAKQNFERGYATLPFTAAQASTQAKNSTEATINGMNLAPSVSKIGVPTSVTSEAKQKVTDGVSNIHGNLSKIDGAATAGKEAGKTASDNCTVKATMTVGDISAVALDVKTRLQNWFASNPIIAAVRAAASVARNAEGGIIQKETLSWLAEDDKPEAVIPLAASQRANALSLYEQTGELLGIKKVSSVPPTTMTLPGSSGSSAAQGGTLGINTDQLYAAVASAAKRGMESANIKIYWDNREAGRIMKNMGVQFV